MRSPLALLCALALGLAVGCASTTQTMPPATGNLTLNFGSPDNPARVAGITVVAVGCQVGYTAKPVGLDVLNPAVDAAAQYNQGTQNTTNSSGDLGQQKPSVLPSAKPAKPPIRSTPAPAKTAAEPASGAASDTPAASPAASVTEDTPAAPSGGS